MALEDTASFIRIFMWVFIAVIALAAGGKAAQKKHYVALAIIIIAFVLGVLFAGGISIAASIIYLIWASSQDKKANAAIVTAQTTHISTQKISSKVKSEEADEEEPVFETKIKCRFCKKSYSSEYNGCPYCKKK